jgi:hypothetical protein
MLSSLNQKVSGQEQGLTTLLLHRRSMNHSLRYFCETCQACISPAGESESQDELTGVRVKDAGESESRAVIVRTGQYPTRKSADFRRVRITRKLIRGVNGKFYG